MRLDLTQLIRSVGMEKPFDYSFEITDVELMGINPFKNGVATCGKVFNIGGALVIQAEATSIFHSICDRCQKEFQVPLSVSFEFNLALKETEETGEDTIIVSGGMLDINELVRDNLILAVPMKLLCNEDCKGLCVRCGVDLNEVTCSCVEDVIDSRLSVLKDLI